MKKTDILLNKILLQRSGLTWNDAIRLVVELAEQLPPQRGKRLENMAAWREAIRLGVQAWKQTRETEELGTAIRKSLMERSHLRKTTQMDLRFLSRRFLRFNPDWNQKQMRGITSRECRQALERAFRTPSQFKKGRAFLHSIFSFGLRQEWCAENPVVRVPIPPIKEREITPLRPDEVRGLLAAATLPAHLPCAPALGLMLWAGIRPHEIRRLRGKDIDLLHNRIILRPKHTKTGGPRLVSILPPLKQWLRVHPPGKELCPPGWTGRWKALRQDAGFSRWVRDVLRHTFASYHFQCHGDLNALQREMGHRSPDLLLSRYLNPYGLEPSSCKELFLTAQAGTRSRPAPPLIPICHQSRRVPPA